MAIIIKYNVQHKITNFPILLQVDTIIFTGMIDQYFDMWQVIDEALKACPDSGIVPRIRPQKAPTGSMQ
jgi:hypothetical protein